MQNPIIAGTANGLYVRNNGYTSLTQTPPTSFSGIQLGQNFYTTFDSHAAGTEFGIFGYSSGSEAFGFRNDGVGDIGGLQIFPTYIQSTNFLAGSGELLTADNGTFTGGTIGSWSGDCGAITSPPCMDIPNAGTGRATLSVSIPTTGVYTVVITYINTFANFADCGLRWSSTDHNFSGSGSGGKWTGTLNVTVTGTVTLYVDNSGGGDIYLTAMSLSLPGTGFKLASNGTITANQFNAQISSNIVSGTIAGFTLNSNGLSSGKTSYSDPSTGVWVGTGGISLGANFSVDASGNVTANSGTFTGNGSGLTSINGANIQTGTVSASALNFTPVGTTNIVGTINASSEGITISGAKLTINSSTTFASGYNPTGKVAAGGAAADVNANTTTINGGKITTGTITASQIAANTITASNMNVSSLSAISANLGTITAGSLSAVSISGGTITGSTVTTASSGARMEMGTSMAGGGDAMAWYDGSGNEIHAAISSGTLYFYTGTGYVPTLAFGLPGLNNPVAGLFLGDQSGVPTTYYEGCYYWNTFTQKAYMYLGGSWRTITN